MKDQCFNNRAVKALCEILFFVFRVKSFVAITDGNDTEFKVEYED